MQLKFNSELVPSYCQQATAMRLLWRHRLTANHRLTATVTSLQCYVNKILAPLEEPLRPRSGKSTLISLISNSVTHLRSYTNTAIADNSAPITPRDRRRLRIERRYRRIEWPLRDRRLRRAKRRRLRIDRRYRRIEWRVFHDVSHCFKSVSCFTHGSWCFTSGSRCFTMYHNVSCFTMFNNVLCLASRAMIGGASTATARPPIASDRR